MWGYDRRVISQLTKNDILNAVNTIEKSNLTRVQYSTLLGQVCRHKINFKIMFLAVFYLLFLNEI